MTQWPLVPLGELGIDARACIGGPFGSELTTKDYITAPGVPVIRGSNLRDDGFLDDGFVYVSEAKARTLQQNQARPGDITFTQRGTIGQVALIPPTARHDRYVLSQSQMKLTPDLSRIDPRFLVHYFRSPSALSFLAHNTLATGVPHINLTILRRVPVPLPPLSEQRRIADILDKAEAVRRKRKDAIALTEELLRSAFLEMVGPQAPDYSRWRDASLESLAATSPNAMRTGPFGSDLRHSEFVDEGVAVLGIDNAVQNRFAWAERRYITREKYEALTRYTVKPNDVIVTIMGTTGRSAVVPEDIPLAITTKHLATLTLNRELAEPEFVAQAIHRHPAVLAQIARANRGAIMSGLNLGLIKSLVVRLPPRDAQREFARLTGRVRALKSQLRHADDATSALFGALVQRAFRGELRAG